MATPSDDFHGEDDLTNLAVADYQFSDPIEEKCPPISVSLLCLVKDKVREIRAHVSIQDIPDVQQKLKALERKLDDSINDLKKKVDQLNGTGSGQQARNHDDEQRFTALEKELKNVTDESTNSVLQIEKWSQIQLDWQKTIEDFEKDVALLDSTKSRSEQTKAELEQTKAELKLELKQAKVQLEQQAADSKQLKKEIIALQQYKTADERAKYSIKEDLDNLKTKYNELNDQNKSLKEDVSKCNEAIRELTNNKGYSQFKRN